MSDIESTPDASAETPINAELLQRIIQERPIVPEQVNEAILLVTQAVLDSRIRQGADAFDLARPITVIIGRRSSDRSKEKGGGVPEEGLAEEEPVTALPLIPKILVSAPTDSGVSRQHMSLTFAPGADIVAEDFSKFGTRLNGQKIHKKKVPLSSGLLGPQVQRAFHTFSLGVGVAFAINPLTWRAQYNTAVSKLTKPPSVEY